MVKAKSTSVQKSERLFLAEAINKYSKTQEELLQAFDELKKYKSTIFEDLDTQIDIKKEEKVLLDKEFDTKKKDLQIECDQVFKEYQYEAALKVLDNRDEEPIGKEELQDLKDELAELKEEMRERIESEIEKEREASRVALKAALTNAELKHKAEFAATVALADQKEKEVQILNETIKTLKHEVEEQRSLTRSVAESSRQGAINQTITK